MLNKSKFFLFAITGWVLIPVSSFSQSRIPDEYRGSESQIARGVLDGNDIETNFRNHGEMARWGDIPWGIWPRGAGGKHVDGIGFLFAAEVLGERIKWYDGASSDTTINPVILNYRDAGKRESPYLGSIWGWLPLNGFYNSNRTAPIGGGIQVIPAASDDRTSWPDEWPDRLAETEDSGWPDSWNGYRGKGLATGDQETFYVMDDLSDQEYAANIETEGPHSRHGVYYPSPSDSSKSGLGLQTEVRTFQFHNVLAKDILFIHYRTTNISEKDLERSWTGLIFDVGLGVDEDDDNIYFDFERNLYVFWDNDGFGTPTTGGSQYELGYMGLMLLEVSFEENNGIDEDNDGMIDESKFNGPGDMIIGHEAIEAYLNDHYNMEAFERKFIDLEEFPAYQFGIWWTGDEDLDWVPFDDFNKNGRMDEEEGLLDDVGRDGLGPFHENYPGPDEGEGDGIPTQGEPNFGELDMMEAENRNTGNRFADLNTRPFYESDNNLRDDTWLFDRIKRFALPENPSSRLEILDADPFLITGFGPNKLASGSSSYFITALLFAETEEDLYKKATLVETIYESDYGYHSKFLTGVEENFQNVPQQIELSQNYPNPFNPTTNIRFSLSNTAPVSLNIYDITGRLVSTVIQEELYNSGRHTVQFNAANLASGVYIYRLNVNGEVFTKKLTLIK